MATSPSPSHSTGRSPSPSHLSAIAADAAAETLGQSIQPSSMNRLRALLAILEPGYVLLVVAVIGLTCWSTTLSRRVADLASESDYRDGISGAPEAQVGDLVPALRVVDLDGVSREIQYEGLKRYVYFVFSPLCPHCQRQLGAWRSIAADARAAKVEVRWLSTEDRALTEAHLSGLGPRAEVLLLPHRSLRAYRVAAVPQTMLVSARGEVTWSQTGELSSEGVAALKRQIGGTR